MKKEIRGGSRTAATSKVQLFVIIVNGFQLLTIITKSSTLDVAAVLNPPLEMKDIFLKLMFNTQKNYMNFIMTYYFYQKERKLKK